MKTGQIERRDIPIPWAIGKSLPGIASATVSTLDAVIIGLSTAGLSLDALSAYLGLTRDNVFEHVVRLRLPTPADTPLRKPSKSGWTVDDIQRLIAWRSIGVHPDVIGQHLSRPRSANAARSKARRLGLVAPPRKILFRPTIEQLSLPLPAVSVISRDSAAPVNRSVIRGSVSPAQQTSLPLDPKPVPKSVDDVDLQDLTWVGSLRGRRGRPGAATDGISTNHAAVFAIGIVACAAVNRHRAAELLGLTVGAYRTQRTRLGLPRIAVRSAFTDVFDVEVGQETIKRANLEIVASMRRTDGQPPQFFWRYRDERQVRLAPSERLQRKRGEPTYCKPITIVTRSILDAESRISGKMPISTPPLQFRSSRPGPIVPPCQYLSIPSAPFATSHASV